MCQGFPLFDCNQKLQNKLEIKRKKSWMIIQKCLLKIEIRRKKASAINMPECKEVLTLLLSLLH